MTKKLFILTIFLLSSIPVFAQSVHTDWVRRYNGPGNDDDYVWAMAVDNSGNIYVTGSSWASWTYEDYATIKYYPNGDTAWVRRYNGPVNGDDVARAIVVDASGNVYVTGWSWGGSSTYDYATVKYDALGNELWVRRYNGPGNYFDEAYAIAVDGYENTYVTGCSYDSLTGMDYTTIKYDSNGNELWMRRYSGAGNQSDFPNAIAVDVRGNVCITGESHQGNPSAYTDYATVKYYPNGDTAWVRRYEGGHGRYDVAYAVAVDSFGNVYVTGHGNDVYSHYATVKYDSSGKEAWVKKYNGCGRWDGANAIALDAHGNIYVTGQSERDQPGYSSIVYYDYATIKYYPNGDRAWVSRYEGPGDKSDFANAIAVDACGNVYVTGHSYHSETYYECATIGYDSSGRQIWAQTYGQPGSSFDAARAIAVDDFGNVYVTGWSYDSVTAYDYVTIRYTQDQVFAAEEKQDASAYSFNLYQNYPNPFNPQTTIQYTLDFPSKLSLKIYNIKGQLVKTLINANQRKGIHKVTWNGTNEKGENTSSGIYFYKLKTPNCVLTKKMLKLR